jgi:hypothetical protein
MLNRLVRILSPEKRAASPATSSPTASPPAAASTLSGGHTANFENSRTSMNLESEQPPATTLPIPHETWFRLLQDVGKEMTPAEFAKFTENDRKTKAHHISFGGYFYRDLYILAEHVYDFVDGKRESEFDRLPKKNQRTVIIHAIGKIIAGRRTKVARSEMTHEPLTKESEYECINFFYSLSQETIFDVLRSRYGVSVASMMKVTVDDKVRVAGLVITKAPLREYLSDLTGRSRGGDRQALDASRARRNAGLQLLHANFIDPTMMVTIPPKWFEVETKEKIDEFMGEGVYDEHGKFDPNNPTRISFPWTVKDTTAIFTKLDKEYHLTMDKYTMGTGGGPGDDANFACCSLLKSTV